MIRQLAIAVDVNGCIGNAAKLLCNCPADMVNFAKFTRGTALIAGRKTAQEMLGLGFTPSESRPLVVLSEASKLSPVGDCVRHVYYAKNLAEAVDTAVNVSAKTGLLGYTVVGGKTVYDEFLLPASGYKLDAVYLATFQMPMVDSSSPDAVRLAGGYPGSQLGYMMNNPKSCYLNADVHAGVPGTGPKRIPVSFSHIHDAMQLDPTGVTVMPNEVLRIVGANGTHAIPLNTITGYCESRGAAHLEVFTQFHKFDIRLSSGYSGVAYLKHIIDQHLISKGSK